MKHTENEGSDLLTPIFYTHRVPHGPDEATTPTLPGRDPCPTVHSRRAPQAPASRQHSKLIEAGHRDGAAVLGFQGAEVVEGVDALVEVGRDVTEADFQCFDDRLTGLSQ